MSPVASVLIVNDVLKAVLDFSVLLVNGFRVDLVLLEECVNKHIALVDCQLSYGEVTGNN